MAEGRRISEKLAPVGNLRIESQLRESVSHFIILFSRFAHAASIRHPASAEDQRAWTDSKMP